MPDLAYVGERIVPLGEATIPLLDRNVTFADAGYEVMRSLAGRLLFEGPHWDRLERTLTALEIPMPARGELSAAARALIAAAGYDEAVLVVHVSRGIGPRNRFDTPARPSWYEWVTERQHPGAARMAEGIELVSMVEERWARRDLKTTMLLPNVLAARRARAAGAYDALFVGEDGIVNESTAANVGLFAQGVLATPGCSSRLLGGITREVVLEVARAEGWTVEERPVRIEEIRTADEVFLTGTTVDVMPVVAVDGVRIGTGEPGPQVRRLAEAYERRCRAEAEAADPGA